MPRIESKPKTTIYQGVEIEVETIDCSPTWCGMLKMLLEVQANGETRESRKTALNELMRMANAADKYNQEVKELQTSKICIEWTIKQVHEKNAEMEDRDLTDEDAYQILQHVEGRHDENFGITWGSIEYEIDNWYKANPVAEKVN